MTLATGILRPNPNEPLFSLVRTVALAKHTGMRLTRPTPGNTFILLSSVLEFPFERPRSANSAGAAARVVVFMVHVKHQRHIHHPYSVVLCDANSSSPQYATTMYLHHYDATAMPPSPTSYHSEGSQAHVAPPATLIGRYPTHKLDALAAPLLPTLTARHRGGLPATPPLGDVDGRRVSGAGFRAEQHWACS
ncbi:hypothetical protein ONZ51_g11871 [Trametes cubensis]|uniref:Uncharacterized protein n=1 Tax=Trametes cubensis TaxID=1111947 RepID=A0AAD7TJC1_9APHY|nr:hypothetical protein ONZ51_g11871 [Trametes cubensis]